MSCSALFLLSQSLNSEAWKSKFSYKLEPQGLAGLTLFCFFFLSDTEDVLIIKELYQNV